MKMTIRGRTRRISDTEFVIGSYILVGLQDSLEDGEVVTITGNTEPDLESLFTRFRVDSVRKEIS